MLKKILTLTLVFVGIFTLTACGGDDTPTMSELEKLQEAFDGLDEPTITEGQLTLLDSGLHGVTITWASDKPLVISNDGMVTNPVFGELDQTVTLTATLTLGDNEFTKDFEIVVPAITVETDDAKAARLIVSLIFANQDVVTDVALVETHQGFPVTWATDNADFLAADGTVTRPAAGAADATVVLTATFVVGTATVTKDFTFTVLAEESGTVYTTVLDLHTTAAYQELVQFTGIVTGVMDKGYFLSDGTHAISVYLNVEVTGIAIGDEVQVTGQYVNYNTLYQIGNITAEEVLSTGNANPLEGTATVATVAEVLALDSTVREMHGMYYEITGTVAIIGDYGNVYIVDGDDQILISYYGTASGLAALEAEVGKDVTITVFYYTEHGTNGPIVAFDGGTADITINTLPDADAIAADIASLDSMIPSATVSTIVLPTEGANGTVFSNWASDTVAVLDDMGAFVAYGAETTTVTFTATATKGSLTETVTVEVMVPVLSTVAEVNMMDLGSYVQVSGTVYEISYYGLYIEEAGSYLFVFGSDYVADVVVGDNVTIIASLGAYSGLTQASPVADIVVNSQGNADAVTPVVTTVAAALNDLVARGTRATITGTVSIEGSYNNAFITDSAGGKVQVYYRSNADDVKLHDGQIITLTVITYQDGTVLFNGVDADIVVETAMTEAYTAQAATDLLMINPMVEMDLVLPVENTDAVATIAWASDNEAVIATDGTVVRVAGSNTTVTLTATVTVGGTVLTRDFVLTVLDANDMDALTVTDALLLTDGDNVLVKGVVIGKYYDEVVIQDATGASLWIDSNIGSDIGDEIVVRGDLDTKDTYGNNNRILKSASLIDTLSMDNALVVNAETDVAVIFAEFNEMQRYTATFTVTHVNDGFGYAMFNTDGGDINGFKFKIADFAPYFEDIYVVGDMIEITFTALDFSFDNVRMVNVVLPALSDADALSVAVAAVDVAAVAAVDVTLPTEMYGVAIAWASDNAAITDMGVVTQPATGSGDATVTLTATFTIGVETSTQTFTVTVPEVPAPTTTGLFFSEYAEADGGNCKYVEIYNGTDATVDLSEYSITKGGNGTLFAASGDNVTLSGTLAAGAVLVVGNSGCVDVADAAQTTATVLFPTTGIDWLVSTVVGYVNGDDAIGLFHNGVLIDAIGQEGVDPGTHWMVGNGNITDGETRNVILIRVPAVTQGSDDWAVGAMQWIVATDDRDYSTVGVHTVD